MELIVVAAYSRQKKWSQSAMFSKGVSSGQSIPQKEEQPRDNQMMLCGELFEWLLLLEALMARDTCLNPDIDQRLTSSSFSRLQGERVERIE